MSWIDPGLEILAAIDKPWRRGRIVGSDETLNKAAASKRRKLQREKLWDLRNPGKRRSYDRGLRARVKRWRKENPEKVREMARRYAASEHGKEMLRAKSARYRAKKRARRGQEA